MQLISYPFLLICFLFSAALHASQEIPVDNPPDTAPCQARLTIENNHNAIRDIISKAPDDESMRNQISALMESFVDFAEFGKQALGKHWEPLNNNQKKDYLDAFKHLLKRTYLRRFTRGQDFSFSFRSDCRMNKTGNRLELQTTLKSGDTEVDVDYRFHKVTSGWLVYDIVVDEVSVMRNYRTSFVKVIINDGFDTLLSKMKSKADSDDPDDNLE